MSFVSASFAPLLHLHAAPSALAIGFSLLLVASLVAAEEVEVRRGRQAEGRRRSTGAGSGPSPQRV